MLIHRLIQDHIETTLNDNTKDIKFKTGKFIQFENQLFVVREKEGRRLVEKDFVPAVMPNFIGSYINIKDVDSGQFEIPIQFYIAKDKIYEDRVQALYEFSKAIVGDTVTLGESPATYNVVFGASVLSPPSEPLSINGNMFVEFEQNVRITFTSGFILGNADEYELNNEDIPFISATETRGVNGQTTQLLGEDTSKTVNEDNVFTLEISFYEPNDFTSELGILVSDIRKKAYKQNKTYSIKRIVTKGTQTEEETFTMRINSASRPTVKGEMTVVTVEFIEALDISVPTP